MEEYFEAIRTSRLFRGMDSEEIRSMLTCLGARRAQYDRGEYLMREGGKTRMVGLVLHGRALIIREDFWGNRSILAGVEPGELYAESFAVSGERLAVDVVAAEKLSVMQMDIERVARGCSMACEFHARLIMNLMEVMAEKNLQLTGKLTHMAQRTTREKLLSYLSSSSRAAGSATFEIPFDRQQLADYLSVDRSAMSTELGKLKAEGLVAFEKNRFTLMEKAHAG